MIATVKCYYNTGLTIGNCVDSINTLDSLGFTTRDFPNIAIKQDRGIINIRINTVYDNVKDADYCKINDVCYWVTSILMLNDNVAQLTLQQDYITTVGFAGLIGTPEIVSGWCVRRHVLVDDPYTNIIDEPFAPSQQLQIDFGGVISGSGSSDGFTTVVVSSIDLTAIEAKATAYLDDSNDKVLVPDLPISSGTTTVYKSHITGEEKTSYIALADAYTGTELLRSALSKVRSLGVESCIVACYSAPSKWIAVDGSGGKITDISDYSNTVTSTLDTQFGSYKNKKVYSGQFQKIVCYSLASGASIENRIEDIINESNSIVWATSADPRYNGNPVCRPKYFHKTENIKLIGSINGAKWQSTPISYAGGSGYGFLQNSLETNVDRMDTQRLYSIMSMMGGALGGGTNLSDYYNANGGQIFYNGEYRPTSDGIANASNIYGTNPLQLAGGFTSGVSNIGSMSANIMYAKQQLFNSYNQSMATIDVQFPRIPSFQDYIGNDFYDMRYRLSDNDMTRFDNFLTQFGYAVDELLTQECFNGRTHFNYVQARDVSLKKLGCPQYLLVGAAQLIEAGVRIWHTAPSHDKLLDNPIS